MRHPVTKLLEATRGPLSELRKFALWFHQDWKLDYGDFRSGLELFLEYVSTPTSRRAALAKELREFLDANTNASSKYLTRQWFKLGAGGTDPDQDIRDGALGSGLAFTHRDAFGQSMAVNAGLQDLINI